MNHSQETSIIKVNLDPTRVENKRKDSFESESSSTFGTTSSQSSSPTNGVSISVHSKSSSGTSSSSSPANNYDRNDDNLESIIKVNKYLRKASKLLINKSNSPWLSWLKGYQKKSGKYLNIFEQIIPELQGRCTDICNDLECTLLNIRRSQTTLLTYLVLLKLSYCLYSSKSYLYEDVLDETKKLKFTVEGEKKKIEAGQLFNRELLFSAESETKILKSRKPSSEPQYVCEIGESDECGNPIKGKETDVINIGKSKRHEHQPAVWVGQPTSNHALPVRMSPPSSPDVRIKRAKSIDTDLCDMETIQVSLAIDEYNSFADKKIDGIDHFLKEIDEYQLNIMSKCEKDRIDQKQIKGKINEIKMFLIPDVIEKLSGGLMQCDSIHEFHDVFKSGVLTDALASMPSLASEGHSTVQWSTNYEVVLAMITPFIEEALGMPTDTNDQVLRMMAKVNHIFFIVNKQMDMDEITSFVKEVNDLVVNQREVEIRLEKMSSLLEKVVGCSEDLKSYRNPPQKSIGRSSMSGLFVRTTVNDHGELSRSESFSSTSSSAKVQRRHTVGTFSRFQIPERSSSSFV